MKPFENLVVKIRDYITLDETALRAQVFSACRWTIPPAALELRLDMPLFDLIRNAIERNLSSSPPEIAAEQKNELARAEQYRQLLTRGAGYVLRTAMIYYGGRAAVAACAQFLRLGAGEITARLASFQLAGGGVVGGDILGGYYDVRDTAFSVCRAIYEPKPVVRVRFDQHESSRSWFAWLPLTRLPDDQFRATDIDAETWICHVVPQLLVAERFHGREAPPWLRSRELVGWIRSADTDGPPRESRPAPRVSEADAQTARVCLNMVTDPPTRRFGPLIFPAPETSGQFLTSTTLNCLSHVRQVAPREWRAPSIWHAVLWLRDLAAWDRNGRPDHPRLSKAFADAPAGIFLFRGQRNAQWPLTPSILRIPDLERRALTAMSVMRFILAMTEISAASENASMLADAYIGAAQHYDLPTWFLDFSVDPLSAAFFASDQAMDSDTAAIYFIPFDAATGHGGQIILAPFWVERLYAQRGCFLDRRALILDKSVDKDPLQSECHRVIFPASRVLAESEYGNVDGAVYPENAWMDAAIAWAKTSSTMPTDPKELASELLASAGQAPWVGGSAFGHNQMRMLTFVGLIVEWFALALAETDGKRRFDVTDSQMRALFRQNPGLYAQLNEAIGRIKPIADVRREADLHEEDGGIRALIVWLYNQHDANTQRNAAQ
jgi:hypothetical protein